VTGTAPACSPGDPGDGVPTCRTGPLDRLKWTMREIAGLIGSSRTGPPPEPEAGAPASPAASTRSASTTPDGRTGSDGAS